VPLSFLLTSFEPVLEEWEPFLHHYGKPGKEAETAQLCRYFSDLAAQQPKSTTAAEYVDFWLGMAKAYQSVSNEQQAQNCLQNAVQCDPADLAAQRELARLLLSTGQFAEAERELRRCLQRAPHDSRLQAMLHQAVRERVERSTVSQRKQPDRLRQ